MISIAGLLYDGQSSRQIAAQLHLNTDNQLYLETPEGRSSVAFSDIDISPRIGNTPRFIDLSEGRRFETADNDAIDLLETKIPNSGSLQWVHHLESRLKYVLATLVFVIVFSWGFIQFGIPALSKTIAFILPTGVSQSIGQGTLELLDEWAFSESELAETRRQELRKKMLTVLPTNTGYTFDLQFRKGNAFGANAFALPDGTIVFTDEIIALSENDDELITVMAHEVGHVVHRHNLRRLVQDSSLAIVLVAVTGDVSTTSSLLLALPTLMVEASYSQVFEIEADSYALNYIQEQDMDGSHFVNLMSRLENQHNEDEAPADKSESNRILDYFSSHPPTKERIKRFAPES